MSEKLDVRGDSISVGTQMALVGATMPRDMDNILEGVVPVRKINPWRAGTELSWFN